MALTRKTYDEINRLAGARLVVQNNKLIVSIGGTRQGSFDIQGHTSYVKFLGKGVSTGGYFYTEMIITDIPANPPD